MKILNVPHSMLPEVKNSSAVYGQTAGSISGIPIVGIAGDQQSAEVPDNGCVHLAPAFAGLQADMLDIPVVRAKNPETTAMGSAEQILGFFRGCIESQAPFIIQASKGAHRQFRNLVKNRCEKWTVRPFWMRRSSLFPLFPSV